VAVVWAAEVDDRIRQAAETIYQGGHRAELSSVIGALPPWPAPGFCCSGVLQPGRCPGALAARGIGLGGAHRLARAGMADHRAALPSAVARRAVR